MEEKKNEQGRGNGISETNGMNFGRGRGAEPITHSNSSFQPASFIQFTFPFHFKDKLNSFG